MNKRWRIVHTLRTLVLEQTYAHEFLHILHLRTFPDLFETLLMKIAVIIHCLFLGFENVTTRYHISILRYGYTRERIQTEAGMGWNLFWLPTLHDTKRILHRSYCSKPIPTTFLHQHSKGLNVTRTFH